MTRFFLIATLFYFLPLSQLWAEEPIKIGAIFSLSGWASHGGAYEKNALDLALTDVNNSGGILGRKVEIIYEDNKSDLKQNVTAFKKLVDLDKVPVIIGPNWAEFLEVIAPLANTANVPMISPSGYRAEIFENNSFVFTLIPPHSVAIRSLFEEIKLKGFKKILLLVTENGYTIELSESLISLLKEEGIKFEQLTFKDTETDFKHSILKIKQSDTDLVVNFLVESGSNYAFFKQAKELKLNLPIFGCNTISYDTELKANPAIAEGAIFFDFIIKGGNDFINRYKKKYHTTPVNTSSYAYDALFLVKKSIEECGYSGQEINDCLKKISYMGISGPIEFDSKGVISTVKTNSTLFTIKNGQIVNYLG
ncbi:MAG: ABC transporter substrate-binding protein [Bdellovibrionales bacterium]|nr:ABC transporter substrate-binding protein [Bdellovibrionales bacterium]